MVDNAFGTFVTLHLSVRSVVTQYIYGRCYYRGPIIADYYDDPRGLEGHLSASYVFLVITPKLPDFGARTTYRATVVNKYADSCIYIHAYVYLGMLNLFFLFLCL